MKIELFPFQKKAVSELRIKTAEAIGSYHRTAVPQVVSLQAPTGSGKTIIMAALIEDIYFGNHPYSEQPEAIFVWLSDSPALNTQSKDKLETKADKLFRKCVTITDESFDMECLEDGRIYFLNTQKTGKAGNLTTHGDGRTYTIWETLANTAREKSDRLYFIIDEAHRGMQGREAGKATSIMQRFLKGYPAGKLPAMPVVIGISATAKRFNALVGDTSSTLQKCIITANEVRASGLLKDRIVITYPDDKEKYNEMAVLGAAVIEWKKKCDHWQQYCTNQHYAQVNPMLVVQVKAGNDSSVSATDLDGVIAKIEETVGTPFKENEIVHTFGSVGNLTLNGLNVPHIEPTDITDDKRIRVVLFKENLSTGWDCPRAETMVSFRTAEDPTYIAQLLGRMVRTPLQCHVNVDDYLNDVRLFLPQFNRDNVKNVVEELQATEGGELPTVIDDEAMDNPVFIPMTVHTPRRPRVETPTLGQLTLQDMPDWNSGNNDPRNATVDSNGNLETPETSGVQTQDVHPQAEPTLGYYIPGNSGGEANPRNNPTPEQQETQGEQMQFSGMLLDGEEREKILKFINAQGLLTYRVQTTRISGSYLKSLLDLATLLTQYGICYEAADQVKAEVAAMMAEYIDNLHQSGKYSDLANQVLSFKLSVQTFDVFGEKVGGSAMEAMFAATESDLDRQLRASDARLGGYGFPYVYASMRDFDDPSEYKIDSILFAADEDCLNKLALYAEEKFHNFNDEYRTYVVNKSEKCKRQYNAIIADGDKVSKHNFTLPETAYGTNDEGGKDYTNHLYANPETGIVRIKLNNWEAGVIEEESQRDDFVCWLRNPSRTGWALTIPYEIHGNAKPMYPDFLIVRSDLELGYKIDILEPHGPQFSDNLAKSKGLAAYAEMEPKISRVQLIRESVDPAGQKRFKRLDLSKGSIRNKVLHAVTDDDLDAIFTTYGFFI